MSGDAEIAVGMALPNDALHTVFCYPDLESKDTALRVDIEVQCRNGSEFTCFLQLSPAYLMSKTTFEREIFRAVVGAYRQHVDYPLRISA